MKIERTNSLLSLRIEHTLQVSSLLLGYMDEESGLYAQPATR